MYKISRHKASFWLQARYHHMATQEASNIAKECKGRACPPPPVGKEYKIEDALRMPANDMETCKERSARWLEMKFHV